MQPQGFRTRPQLPTILTVPGIDGSGPDHWQTLWEYALPDCRRVEMGDWANPVRDEWVDRLDRAIDAAPGPVVLAAHSLGCVTVAWWAKLRWKVASRHKLLGAMLVAPPCLRTSPPAPRLCEFRPLPRELLPFPSILIASRDDPNASFETSAAIAESWGSQLIDAGKGGHLNADSGLGVWEHGVALLESLITSVSDARQSVRSRKEAIDRSGERPRAPDLPEPAPVPANWSRFLGERRSDQLSEDDKSYFQERAEAEIALAQRAAHPDAVRSHYLLAGYYLDLVHCGTEDVQPAR